MKSVARSGLAVLGSAVVLVIGANYVTYAADGSSIFLGVQNVETNTTTITDAGTGSAGSPRCSSCPGWTRPRPSPSAIW